MKKLCMFLAGLIPFLVTGCAAEKDTNTLVFAAGGAPAEIAQWQSLLSDFEKENAGVRVSLHRLPADSDLQLQAHRTALGSGAAPYDLMRLDIVWLASFAARDWLEPLDGYLAGEDLSDFGALLDRADRVNKRLVALPWNVDMGLLYYRKDLLNAISSPPPYPDYSALIHKISMVTRDLPEEKWRGMVGFAWQGKAYEGLTCNFLEHYAAAGGNVATVEKTGTWQKAPALAALKTMQTLIATGLSPANTATEMTEEPSRLLFQQGKAMFMRNWPYAAALLQAPDSPVRGKVGVAPLPGAAALGGWHLGVRKDSPRAALAARLALYLTSAKVQLRLADKLGWNPSRHSVYRSLAPGSARDAVAASLKQIVARPRMERYAAFSQRTYETVNAVLLGATSPEEGAQSLAQLTPAR